MQDHLRFGAPPTLRPRTAGRSRSLLPASANGYTTSATSTSAPERLASTVNALTGSPSLVLRQRLQSPRPGSAAPFQIPRAPGGASSSSDKGEFLKPPMRPKSATAASRVSRHRMQLVQDHTTPLSNNQHDESTPITAQEPESMGALISRKEDAVRPLARVQFGSSLGYGKRPFSASRSSTLSFSNESTGQLKVRVKRPHSAAVSTRCTPFRARDKSSSCLSSCLAVGSHTATEPQTFFTSSSHSGYSRGNRMLVSSRDHLDSTFVYAVPRHCLQSDLPYDPYEIVPVTHELLFGGGSVNEMQDANWDYYTISRNGYTFHAKNDAFEPTFLSLSHWEDQKTQFAQLRRLSTFSAFRYRKVFLGWRHWGRAKKRETARDKLLFKCYFSYPILFTGMQQVRVELARLSNLQLMWDFHGETVSLTDFATANATFVNSRSKELRQITIRVQKLLTDVCRVFLENTAPLNAGFPDYEVFSVRKSHKFHLLESYAHCEHDLISAHQQLLQHQHFQSTRLANSDAAETRAALLMSSVDEHGTRSEQATARATPDTDATEQIRWTMASIKRRKCRQLTRFMTLVDFLVLDTSACVVKQSLDLLRSFVLYGANAGTVRRLTDRDDLALAMHHARASIRNDSTPCDRSKRASLTRQEIKSFLHAAWDGKLSRVCLTEDETASSTELSLIAMETRLEALFFHALNQHTNTETCSVDDLFYVADNALTQLLVLPHFTTADLSIYTTPDAPAPSSSNKSLEQDVLAIPCLRRRPLFSLNLIVCVNTEKRGRRSYQIGFDPELVELVRTLQSLIVGFTDAFRAVPSVLSSPELQSVLDFAIDIRALNLTLQNGRGSFLSSEDSEPRFKCPADRLVERIEEDPHYLSVRDEVQELTRSVLNGASELAACYKSVLELRTQNESVHFDVKTRQFRRNDYTLEQIEADATHFTDQLTALTALQLSVDVEFLRFDMRQLQADLLPSPARCLDAMRELLPRLARDKCDQFLQYIHASSAKIDKPVVPDLDAFAKYLVHLREVYDEILEKELDLTFVHDFFAVLDKLKFHAPLETIKVFELCAPEFQALKSHAYEAYASRETDMQHYAPLLTENLDQLARRMNWLQSTASDHEVAAQSSTCQEARDQAVQLYREATNMQQEASRLTRIQHVFEEAANDLRLSSQTFENLHVLSAELKLKSELWEAVCEADEHLSECSSDTIGAVDLDIMGVVAGHVDLVLERIRQCTSQTVSSFELDRLEKLQATLHGLTPVIRDLRNPDLVERHWSKLEHKMQCSLASVDKKELATDSTEAHVSRLDVQVQQLLQVDAVAHGTMIRHVSEEASAEAAIAGSFLSVVRTWEAQEIPIELKKDRDGRDVYCVANCLELTSLLEESQVLLRVMDLSTYSLVVQERLPKMLHDLEHTKEALDLLQMCQQKWDYTQRLVSIDFARTFPEQAKQLQKHDTMWRCFTLSLFRRSLCLPFGVSPDHRQALQGILKGFEAAAKALADHLEIKRQVFPAFFQLSDLELATLLSKCRDVSCTPSFVFQCFDNIGQIVFGVGEAFQDILQITSRVYGAAETIVMGKNLKARGPVEQWLAAIEKRLAEQLRRSTKQTIELLSRDSLSLDSHFPVQTILLADRVVRCTIIDKGLRDVHRTVDKLDRIMDQLAVYSSSIKAQVLPVDSTRLSAREIALRTGLCLHEIQFRDTFASHVASQQPALVSSLSSGGVAIDWEHQLKYRMDDATTVGYECHVEINTLRLPYGFNYLHPSQDCVVTPSSLRSLFAVFACVRHAQGCVLTGPSESGKRTLSLQVSSILGRRSFAATATSYTHVTRLLLGALHAGGTFCASLQLARDLEASAALIKTLATTLTAIEHAVLTKNPVVGLHRTPIAFVPGTAMLVLLSSTAQLSLADSEDIKLWTEPLSRFAVVQWDWTYIFEALLVSKGFVGPRELAKKLLILWQDVRAAVTLTAGRTASSSETPFSYSALKTIMSDAASILESRPTSHDLQHLLIRQAVVQYFHARIDAEQLDVVESTLENVFPQSEIPTSFQQKQTSLSPDLHECVTLALRELHFVPRQMLLDAVSCLADALAVSTSAVLVGPSGVGKTTVYHVLARALELCLQRRDQSKASTSKPQTVQVRAPPAALSKRSNSYMTSKTVKTLPASVAIHVVLPMALTVTQLYGGVSLDNRGRIPSIMGQLIREAQDSYVPSYTSVSDGASESTSLFDLRNQVWIIFDDALDLRWLEGLLAVLSPNRDVAAHLLPFEDGEFMTLSPNLRLVFEVLQLRDATPRFLHANAILPLRVDNVDEVVQTRYRRTENVDVRCRMTVATAFLHRYVELQRQQVLLPTLETTASWSPLDTFNVVERWLLKTSLLTELAAVLDVHNGHVRLSRLQRVTNLTSLLQSLLSTASSLPSPTRTTADKTTNGVVTFAVALPYGQIRVELALVYSLLWGFAACTADHASLQRQVSDLVRREFDHLAPAWIRCGADVNLFETLLDLPELRFVSVAASGRALSSQMSNHSGISSLFVPTASSLVVHATIHHALRSGRGVLLLGGDGARRTTLTRNFLSQIETIRSIIAAGGVSNLVPAHTDDEARKPVDFKTNEAATLASVKRLRLRQISLVTCMALRLQKDTEAVSDSLQASRCTSVASLATTCDNRTVASVLEDEEGTPLAIVPSTELTATAMVRQFDRGDVIPFFFAMPHSSFSSQHGDVATELANCLERMLQRERTGVFEPPPGKTALLLLDDLHLAIPGQDSTKTQRPVYPSVFAFLRYVQERRKVYRGTSCQPIAVENLMLLASMRVENLSIQSDESLEKLTTSFFPVLAPMCRLEELHQIFGQALQTHWGVPSTTCSRTDGAVATTVRYALPLLAAATTVLWDRLRSTFNFCLQDLARVYEGLAGVNPSLLVDVETLVRLWTHECHRTLREPALGRSSRQDDHVVCEITRMRSTLAQVAQRRASARTSRLSLGSEAGLSFIVAPKRQSMHAGHPVNDEKASPATLLTLFAARSSSTGGKLSLKYSQQLTTFQEQRHHAAMTGGLWAYVPASIYYSGAVVSSLPDVEASDVCIKRQKSFQAGASDRVLGPHDQWLYAEISFEDDSEAVSTAAVQAYYHKLRTFSSTATRNTNKTLSLPRDVPPVPFKLAHLIARIDRVFARPAARLILLDTSSNAVDTLLQFATFSRLPEFPDVAQSNGDILTLSGLPDDPNVTTDTSLCLTMRWKRLLLELYERVGVAGQDATLVVKRLDLLPPMIVNQLQTLMTTGEVPGAMSLEEQVHLATRVCDERLLGLKTKHAVQVAQIRASAAATRDHALALLHQQQRDVPTTSALEAFQRVEMRYQRELHAKLARVDLRWQQDSDDLRREREVESESVAATVMALTRPLGVTSGKWASAVTRMSLKLRVVLLVDTKHEQRVRLSTPSLFATCDVVSVPPLDRESLHTLVYGHFHAQVDQLVHQTTSYTTAPAGLLDFLHQVARNLWTFVRMATDMHLAVVAAVSDDVKEEGPRTTRAFAMASIFAKLVVDGFKREEATRANAAWFLDLSTRLDRDLNVLRSSDINLSEQLVKLDQQLNTYATKLVEQKEDAERIRAIMQRVQVAADEQIQVTNEAQDVAQRELREPMACLEEANRALLLVDRRHLVEIKSFVSPPPLVHLVLGAVCVLFQLEPSWESARRLLLGDANVVQTLLQYNKDAVPASTLAKLDAEYLQDERFCRQEVERQSVAAASMVGWIRAIHQYATARQQVQPMLEKLDKAQNRLNLLMQEFHVTKQRVIEADEAWQATQAAMDTASARKEALTSEIASLDARCDSGELAMAALQEDVQCQQEAARASAMRRGFALTSWNALLSAGTLVYACELSQTARRQRVFQAWEAAYNSYGGLTPGCPPTSTRCSFMPSISVVLNASEEQTEEDVGEETPLSALFTGNYPVDALETTKLVTGVARLGFSQRRLWEASLLSLIATTPALPVVMITRYSRELEELLVTCARRVWHWHQLDMVYARAPDFDAVFRLAARLGHQLLVLDVEPADSELPSDSVHGVCLHAALSWTSRRLDDADHLVMPRQSYQAEEESEDSTETTDSIVLHPNFRLILTSHASRRAFGDVLELIPTLDAQLHPSDVADVMLDHIWSSSVLKSSDPDSTGGCQLKKALREHDRLAQAYEASQTQLINLLEAAAVTSQFPLAQTRTLRDQLVTMQETRHVLKDQRRTIHEQLRSVKRQYAALARTGAAVFNSFNVSVRSGLNALPLTLQVFLPILLDAMASHSTTDVHSTLDESTRLTRSATSFVLNASSRGLLSSLSVSSHTLTTLLTRLAPFMSPASDWTRFLLQVLTVFEKMQPTTLQTTQSSPTQATDIEVKTPRSVNTILLQAKLQSGALQRPLISAEACKELAASYTRPEFQRRVMNLICNGCKTESTSSEAGSIDALVRLELPESSSRFDRLRVSLVLFPDLVQHVCDRVLASYGVLLNVHEQDTQKGFWLRTIRALPEQTAVLLFTRHEFHSFAFARRAFFHGIETSSTIRVRVLQQLGRRRFRAIKQDDAIARIFESDQDEPVPLTQLYVLPRCHYPSEEQLAEARKLLLMTDDVQHVVQMEKAQFEALEDVPLAIVNMKTSGPEDWEALFRVLHRSCHRSTSTAFQRHSIRLISNVTSKDAIVASAPSVTTRQSSQSMMRRLSAVDLVTPTYPRLVAVVGTLKTLPVHLRTNFVCFRDEEAGSIDGGPMPSLCKCLQSTILRLVLYPCVQTLSRSEDDTGTVRTLPPDLWVVITGLVLFHSLLLYRSHVLRATYVGALPSSSHPVAVFHYSDDVFLTAMNQCVTSLAEPQRRRTETTSTERRVYQQIVLGSYARLGAGQQEVAVLKALLLECLQLAGWHEPSVVELGIQPRKPSSSLAQLPVRLSSPRLRSGPATLDFLAFPTEDMRQPNLSLSQWLELMWLYSSSINQYMNSKLQRVLLGSQPNSVNHRGDSYRDVFGGIGLFCPSPKWMWAFGWASDQDTASVGDAVALTVMMPLHVAIQVVQAIVTEALPRCFTLESWHHIEKEEKESGRLEGQVGSARRIMMAVYNQHVDVCSSVFETILNNLLEHEQQDSVPTHTMLQEADEHEQADEDDDSDNVDVNDGNSSRLIDLKDDIVRQQVMAILRNEVPSSMATSAPITSSWSLHDVLQHYQDWHEFFTRVRPLESSQPLYWWLPGLLASNLPVKHMLEVSRARHSTASYHNVHFTLRLEHDNLLEPDDQRDADTELLLDPNPFAILDGVVLLGATWNEDKQHLDRVDELQLHHRVQLVCYMSSDSEQPSHGSATQRVPLLASHDGSLLLECALAVHPGGSPLATPFLVPLGSHYR